MKASQRSVDQRINVMRHTSQNILLAEETISCNYDVTTTTV